MSREQRVWSADLEIRGDGRTVCGIACPFDAPTDLGRYVETIARTAFDRTIAERGPQRVKFLAQHNDRALPIGRATVLRPDTAGLYAELRVSKTSHGDEVLELIKDGALDGLSIGFDPVPATDRWSADRSSVVRHEVRLAEISAVTVPAYELARVTALRSLTPETFSVALARRRAQLEGAI